MPSYTRQRFCGHSCAFKSTRPIEDYATYNRQLGRDSAEKIGDALRGTGDGYVKRGGRHEHRVVMEKMLGRPLAAGEIVHHDDECKSNNAPDNLLLTDRAEHGRLHNLGRKRTPRTVCKNGHPLTEDNVIITSAGRRRCKTCARSYDTNWHRNKREMERCESSV